MSGLKTWQFSLYVVFFAEHNWYDLLERRNNDKWIRKKLEAF